MLITESHNSLFQKDLEESLKKTPSYNQIIEQIIGNIIKWLILRLDILNIFILYSINFIQS
jgi:hypothetical protein